MNSSWLEEIKAVTHKEWLSDSRNITGFQTMVMFGVTTVFALAFAAFGKSLEGQVGAGLLWVGLLFNGISAVSKSLLNEEEQGTADLLRMWSRPHAVFWGKALYASLQMVVMALLLSTLFLVLTGLTIKLPLIFLLSLLGGSVALAGVVTLCSALISRGAQRGSLVGIVSLPILLPLIALGVSAGRASLGEGFGNGWVSCGGTWAYAVLLFAIGPHLFAFVWDQR